MKTFHTLQNLIEIAVTLGHNKKEATDIITSKYDYIKRVHPNVSAKKAVHIAYVIY